MRLIILCLALASPFVHATFDADVTVTRIDDSSYLYRQTAGRRVPAVIGEYVIKTPEPIVAEARDSSYLVYVDQAGAIYALPIVKTDFYHVKEPVLARVGTVEGVNLEVTLSFDDSNGDIIVSNGTEIAARIPRRDMFTQTHQKCISFFIH